MKTTFSAKITATARQILTFLLALVVTLPVHATIPSEDTLDFFDRNGIYYYNPLGMADDPCNTTATTLAGNTIQEKIWNFFIGQGFTDAQTAGILGNAMAESGFTLTRSANGAFWGLFQWGGGRRDNLQARIRQAGLGQYLSSQYFASGADRSIPPQDYDRLLSIELEYAMSEHDLNWQEELKTSASPEESAEIFLVLFERAVNGESPVMYYSPYKGLYYQGTSARRNYARQFFEEYSGKSATVSSGLAVTGENGRNLALIGDHLVATAQPAILEQFSALDASAIHRASSWQDGLNLLNSTVTAPIVVFTPPFDGVLDASALDAVVDAVGSQRNLILVTRFSADQASDAKTNRLYRETAKRHLNLTIADWSAVASRNPQQYFEDPTNPVALTASGQKLYAETLFRSANSTMNANGCLVDNDLQSLVKSYAWPDFHPAPWHERMPAYAEAVSRSLSEGRYVGGSVAGVPGIDCGGFVTILVQNSGLEPSYNDGRGATGAQEAWVQEHHWRLLNASPHTAVNTAELQPGDVAFSSGHTFIYVGDIEGFHANIASASYSTTGSGRAPMAGAEDLVFGNGVIVRWYRKP